MSDEDSERPVEYAVAVPHDDPDIAAAVLAARDTLGQFANFLTKPSPTRQYQAVKISVSREGDTDYLWFPVVASNAQTFEVEPEAWQRPLLPYNTTQKLSIRWAEVYDWMIVDDGKLIGGYSLHVMRSKMNPEQRSKFDARLWYDMD